ncbi:MAG TPA: carboxypeptidase regulatory-like domain-containing protein [Bryobacteraceae bacterium]|nr:carboxypeptidase regulatory-like domain-containing protein [Bryobacteraceae bacterium]
MRRVSVMILLVLFVLTIQGYAQSITGSLNGRVVDQQGAAVPNARVTATEQAKNTEATTNSTAAGDFSIPGLLPGSYTLTVEAQGFKKLTRANITLNASDKLALGDLTVEIGAVTESVEVSATAALLQTESVERGSAVTGEQMTNIAVDGRTPLDLAKLIPGVQFTTGATYAVGNAANGANQFTANGTRPSQNQVTINGIGDVDTGNNGGMNVSVSNDAVAEFKVLTGTYQAEYGRSAGAQIQLVTKTGTEQYHGSGYLYHRNEGLNANTFLNNIRPQFGLGALQKPLFRYNDPGYNIGGPISIPGLWTRARNKAFFFWSQEWQEQLVPNTARNVTVPTTLERSGNFSQSQLSNHNAVTIYDPLNRTPFAGNVIPASRIWAPGQALLNILPQPNVGLAANSNLPAGANYNYTSQLSGAQPRREDLLRLDYNVTNNLRVYGHYINDVQNTVVPYGSFVLGLNLPIAPIADPIPGRSLAAGATYVISPSMTNEFNWGYTRNSINIFATTSGLSQQALGSNPLPVLYPNAVQNSYLPQVAFSGSSVGSSPTFGSGDAPFINYNTTFDFTDGLTKVWGKHTIKAGFYMQRSRKDQTSFASFNGSYNFGDTGGLTGANPLDTGDSWANALLGVYNSFTQAQNHINGKYRYWNIEEYVQDTWKITPRLTLDYGLRGSWYQPQYDSSLQASTFILANWDPKQAPRLYVPAINPATGARNAYDAVNNIYLPVNDIGLLIPGSGNFTNGICQAGGCINKYLTKNRGEQWGPRFGVAWDVTGKQDWVIRTGGGIYYDRIQGNRTFDTVTNPPEAFSVTEQYGFAQQLSPSTALLSPPSAVEVDPTGKIPTTYSFQFSVQKRLPWSMVLDTAYVGSASRHQQDNRNLNWSAFGTTFSPSAVDPTVAGVSSSRPIGTNVLPQNFEARIYGYGNINLYESAATANYNALQVQLQKRTSHGLFLGVSYTWSKAMATSLSGTTNDNSFVRPDQYNRFANYSPTSFDRRHVLTVNYVYNTPRVKWGNSFTRLATDGWQISGVTIAQTGAPFTPGVSVQNSSNPIITGSYTEGSRPVLVKGCDPYTHSGDWRTYLNPSCFVPASPGSIGLESGINYVYAPGGVEFDLALQKEFAPLREGRLRFQFRVDAFNVFNHTIFTGVNSTLSFLPYPANSSGVITGLPGYTSTTLAINNPAQGCSGLSCTQIGGFGSLTQSGPGAFGYSRILQMLVRVTF